MAQRSEEHLLKWNGETDKKKRKRPQKMF
jgi:hypothetical protein